MANTENDVIHREILKRATETFDPQATTWRECWNIAVNVIYWKLLDNMQNKSAEHALKFIDKEPPAFIPPTRLTDDNAEPDDQILNH